MTDLKRTLVRVHERNINRYLRLLRTKLTKLERDFVMRRLAEERLEIARLTARESAIASSRPLAQENFRPAPEAMSRAEHASA